MFYSSVASILRKNICKPDPSVVICSQAELHENLVLVEGKMAVQPKNVP